MLNESNSLAPLPKTWVAIIALVVSALVVIFARDADTSNWIQALVALLGAAGVYVVPNPRSPEQRDEAP